MLYNVTHITRYLYEAPVSQCLNEVHLTPRSMTNQSVRESKITVEPAPTFLHRWKDYFGNDVTSFEVFEKHDRFVATAESAVEVAPPAWKSVSSIAWEDAQELIAAHSNPECLEAFEFVFDSPFVTAGRELEEYARSSFTAGKPLMYALKELSERIHTDFRYKPMSTSIGTPLKDVLRKRQGVCQDFAHMMIGMLRSLHLPSRYVSGYLRPRPGFKGAQASHAWVSAFVPETGWVDFDPTNNVMPSDGHITLGWGRDYGDVTPMKGIALGGGAQTVQVEVIVAAVPPNSD